jgi:hypothetical protein
VSFAETGLLRLEGALGADEVAAMREAVWRHVERRTAIRRDDRATWPERHAIGFQQLKRHSALRALLANPRLQGALDDVFACGDWARPRPGAQVLLTFPSPGDWTLPHGTWHTDFGIERTSGFVAGVKVFAFVTDVEPGGGGTVVIAGSHRLVERFAEAEHLPSGTATNLRTWARLLGGHPVLRDIDVAGTEPDRTRRLLDVEADVDGLLVRVVELTGRAGDVVVTHMDVLHSAAPNRRRVPRLMLGKSVMRSAQAITRPPFGEIHWPVR